MLDFWSFRIFVLLIVVACGGTFDLCSAQAVADQPIAPVLAGLGSHHHAITTKSERAQVFFNQGLRLVYGFNHAEAHRAFREAARLDPDCAMAYWGQALALGPNINAPMSDEDHKLAYEAIQKAVALKSNASRREQDFIDGLEARYSSDPTADRKPLHQAYMQKMRELGARYPDDDDALTLYADAIMNTMPWDYWTKDSKPNPGTQDTIDLLERVIQRNRDHAGAHHYYIHIVEASSDPDRAVPSADRLGKLMPGAGHIVHMPSHIYLRVGRYADATNANLVAIEADEDYISQCQAQGIYPVGYYPHNIHFLWQAASEEGHSELALDSARKVAAKVPHHHAGAIPPIQRLMVTPLFALVRFGRWQEVLTEPQPATGLAFPNAVWHYARGIAFTARSQPDRGEQELANLNELIKTMPADSERPEGSEPLTGIAQVASKALAGEIAARRNRSEEAINLLQQAVQLQDDLPYTEPPFWPNPTRQTLGAVLLAANRPAEAEAVYRKDLEWHRDNGWTLFGLLQSLRAQG